MRTICALFLTPILALGCGRNTPGGDTAGANDPLDESNSADSYTGPRAEQIEFRLVDAPTDDVTSVVVTISTIEAKAEGIGWTTVASKVGEVDLLSLQGGSFAALGAAKLPAGHISQLRLHLKEGAASHVTTSDGAQHELKVPSGDKTGIKIVGGFDVDACSVGHITIDFDAKKSIFAHPTGGGAGGGIHPNTAHPGGRKDAGPPEGAGGAGDKGKPDAGRASSANSSGADEWVLRPVVRIKAVVTSGACADGGMSEGTREGDDDKGDSGKGSKGDRDNLCENVSCAETEICVNGVCRTPK